MPEVTKAIFRAFLCSPQCEKLLIKWTNVAWNLLPPSSRMAVLDESQVDAIHRADIITAKYKWREACVHYDAVLRV